MSNPDTRRAQIELRRAVVHRQRAARDSLRNDASGVDDEQVVADDAHRVLAGAPDDDAAQLGHVEHAAEQRRPVERGALARELEPSGARVGADLAREPRDAGHAFERLDAEPREVGRHGVVDARVGSARQREVDGAQVAARRQREPRLEQARLRQRREERRQVFEPQEAAAQREVVDAVRIAPDVDVDGRRFGPSAAAARDGDVAQRELPRFARCAANCRTARCARSANRRRRASSAAPRRRARARRCRS